jgi:hypothetical protein
MSAGIARLQPVLAELEAGGPSTALAEASLALAVLLYQNGQLDRGLVHTMRAEAIARHGGSQASG